MSTTAAARPGRQQTWPAALTLFVSAGLIPETVATQNSPPLQLLTRPAAFLFISAFYGSAALLVREFRRRRPARWPGVLLLGAAAGCVNEGIIAGTWYQVQYPGYSMIGPVDPAVAVGLTVFHALVSTALPILLAELIFPLVAGRCWLGRGGMAACAALLMLTTVSGFLTAASRGPKAVVLLGVLAMIAVARLLPAARLRPAAAEPPTAGSPLAAKPPPAAGPPAAPPRLAALRLAGALATAGFFTVFAVIPGLVGAAVPAAQLAGWQLLYVILMCAFGALVAAVTRRWSRPPAWGQRQTLAVLTGVLLPAIIASLLLPAAWRTLEPLATLPVLGLLFWLARRGRKSGSTP